MTWGIGIGSEGGRSSFRDPEGQCIVREGGPVMRVLRGEGIARAVQIAGLAGVRRLQNEGKWIGATAVGQDRLEHPWVPYRSHPQEWSAVMLNRAANLTLEINLELLRENWELKDGTPRNVLFQGTKPVFVDHLSPAPRDPGQIGWRAYGQFCRTFLIPLLLHKHNQVPLGWIFLNRRDGIPPDEAFPILSLAGRLRAPGFETVTLPTLLERSGLLPKGGVPVRGSEGAQEVTERLLRRLMRNLDRLQPAARDTRWSSYEEANPSYDPEGLAAKRAFIAKVLDSRHPRWVLDLGCNNGQYSLLAARSGSACVAIDSDPQCVDSLFLAAEREGLAVQCMVADLARPTPPTGFDLGEESGLDERLAAGFDLTLALALVHHLIIRERIPLDQVVALLARYTRGAAVLEWVEPQDPQFKRMADQSRCNYDDMTMGTAVAALEKHFQILERAPLPGGTRTLVLLEKR